MNIFDIAEKSGVSITTVSRVLNNTGHVKEETRQKILKVIEENHYTPNSLAQGLAKKESKTIGVVITNINNPFYSEMVRAIQDIASQKNYSVMICNTDDNVDEEIKITNTLVSKQVDGIIYAGGRPLDEKLNAHVRNVSRQIPTVLVCEDMTDDNIYCINSDKEMGMYLITDYLTSLGHRNIFFVNTPAGYKPSVEKLNGYKKALGEKGIKICDDYIFNCDNSVHGGYKAGEYIIKNMMGGTAVLCASDIMAMGVMNFFVKSSYQIPRDISIAGFDNIMFSGFFNPTLTTVSINLYKMAEEAARLLDKLIQKKTVKKKIKILEPMLNIRESCKKLHEDA